MLVCQAVVEMQVRFQQILACCVEKVCKTLEQSCIFFLRNGKSDQVAVFGLSNLVLSWGTFFDGIQWLA